MRDRVLKKKIPSIVTARANLVKFCRILDNPPVDFSFKLTNVSKDFDGSWKKTVQNGTAVWQNGSKILFNSSFFVKKIQVLEAIEREGWSVRKLYFPEMRPKITSPLTKEKVKDLYYKQKKSLQDIAKDYGCTKNWVFLLMEKYGLERRTRSDAQKVAISQGRR